MDHELAKLNLYYNSMQQCRKLLTGIMKMAQSLSTNISMQRYLLCFNGIFFFFPQPGTWPGPSTGYITQEPRGDTLTESRATGLHQPSGTGPLTQHTSAHSSILPPHRLSYSLYTVLSQQRKFDLLLCIGAKYYYLFSYFTERSLVCRLLFLPFLTAPLSLHSYATLSWFFSRTSRGPIRRPLHFDMLPGDSQSAGEFGPQGFAHIRGHCHRQRLPQRCLFAIRCYYLRPSALWMFLSHVWVCGDLWWHRERSKPIASANCELRVLLNSQLLPFPFWL